MSDIRFQVSGRGAKDAARKLGALIEGEFSRSPEAKAAGESTVLSIPVSLFKAEDVAAYKGLTERVQRLIGWASWEARNGITVTVKGVEGRPEVRLDDTTPEGVISLARPA
jgi:hypothetical protein